MQPVGLKPKTTAAMLGQSPIIAIILLMTLCIAITITIVLFGPKDIKKAFFVRSIGEAADSCEQKIIKHFNERLVSKYYDEISSRYDANYKQYIIFYKISHTEIHDKIPNIENSMVKCIVWQSLGYVSEFRVFKP